MELVKLTAEGQTITNSLIIAEGTGVEHKAVLQLIRTHLKELEEIGSITFEMRMGNHGGVPVQIAHMNERPATFLLTLMRNTEAVVNFKKNLSKAFWDMAERVDFERLKAQAEAIMEPRNLAKLLCHYADVIEGQEKTIKELQPKADGFDLVANTEGELCLHDAAKTLKKRPNKEFIPWMSFHSWMFRRQGRGDWKAAQDKLDAGLLSHKVINVRRSDGTVEKRTQVMVTHKGLAALAQIFSQKPVFN